jgi:radical SAM superfamily enzyme YgiQ (UPF0313 family)
MAAGWLAMGIPLLSTLLEQAGISARVVRFQDAHNAAPPEILALTNRTLWADAPLEVRLEAMAATAVREPEFFELLLSRLLDGPERVFGFSVWRMNVDVTLEAARQLKQRRPDALILFGGPETSESPQDLMQEWVDLIVKGPAEGVVVDVVKVLLAGRPSEAAGWDNVWVHPRHVSQRDVVPRRAHPAAIPRMDYTKLVPLQKGASTPSFPVLMNLGCPFRCGFCTNTTVYPNLEWGHPQRVVDEMVEIMGVWKSIHPDGDAPGMEFTICDPALNANPRQFDALCEALISADWPLRPSKINGLLIIDVRMTRERVKLADRAGLRNAFFGLESANPRIRRAMKKPGKKEEVAEALIRCREQGWVNSLNTGIIVSWPDETEEEFFETVQFLDWAVALGVVAWINVTPLFRSPGMMDSDLLAGAGGDSRGIGWSLPTAAGSPHIRARRFFHVFEHFAGLVPVVSSVPHELVLSTMLDRRHAGFWERWAVRNGLGGIPNSFESETSRSNGEVLSEPEPPDENRVPDPPVEASTPAASERLMSGRGASVVLRLIPVGLDKGFASAMGHSLSHEGSELPEPLRDVVIKVGRSFDRLPKLPALTDDVWAALCRIVEQVAGDVYIEPIPPPAPAHVDEFQSAAADRIS